MSDLFSNLLILITWRTTPKCSIVEVCFFTLLFSDYVSFDIPLNFIYIMIGQINENESLVKFDKKFYICFQIDIKNAKYEWSTFLIYSHNTRNVDLNSQAVQ